MRNGENWRTLQFGYALEHAAEIKANEAEKIDSIKPFHQRHKGLPRKLMKAANKDFNLSALIEWSIANEDRNSST